MSLEVISWYLWLQMTLSPSYRVDDGKMVRVRTSRKASVAVTQYQVLSSTVSSALLELQPITGERASPAPPPRGRGPCSALRPRGAGLGLYGAGLCPAEQLVLGTAAAADSLESVLLVLSGGQELP